MSAAADYPKRAEEAFNRRDAGTLAALWSPAFEYEAPAGEHTSGRAMAIAREEALWAAFPDIRADLARHFEADGGRLVIEGIMRGTHDGVLRLGALEVPPSGRRMEVHFVALFTFRDGLVAHERVVFDRLDLLQQLGVLPEGGAR
jgi:steroid delta-isomerase-like uncharacterized protein